MQHQVAAHLPSTTILGTDLSLSILHASSYGFLAAYLTYIRSWNFFRTSPSPFVVPVARYNKANYIQQSVGMRMAMMFETEESGKRRFVH